MNLTCVLCSKDYIFESEKIAEEGFRLVCNVCGAKYTVALPPGWRDAPPQQETVSPAVSKGAEDDERYILLADDTAFFRALMSDLLTKQGYKVKTVTDGKEAMETFLASPASFRLLILDLQMPKLSGFGVLEELRSTFNLNIPPVIVMTGVHDSHEDIRIVRDMGAAGFLEKSLDPSVAVERIMTILEEHENK